MLRPKAATSHLALVDLGPFELAGCQFDGERVRLAGRVQLVQACGAQHFVCHAGKRSTV